MVCRIIILRNCKEYRIWQQRLYLEREDQIVPEIGLMALHWLPVWERIEYKILTLVFKCMVGEALAYLREMIQERGMHREGLRSNRDFKFLMVPRTRRQTFVARSFSVAGPTLWNSLPNTIKQSNTIDGFKVKLKTYLFRCAFY